ncbi:valyl-tRNA synthetase [Apiospora aurea]|uniref:Ribosome production factor 2 homolog n=1 Tax=Apiospora aurea TaxID=335848 RepID=A0ABR1QC38_9PEZI
MLRQVKPRNARSKRALEKRAPKVVENPKTALFLRYTTCSEVCQNALSDLYALRTPLAKRFTKKNDIHPFTDPASLEFFSERNDCSMFVFASSSKKRPHTLTLGRTFGHKILDMIELSLEPESYRQMSQFKTRKPAIGLRPMLVFSGTAFDSPTANEYTMAKSMLTELFTGDTSGDKIDVEGLQYLINISADEPAGDEVKPAIHVRVYMISTKRSGHKVPRVEVEEVGPRMDFRPGRIQEPQEDMWKEALKKPKAGEERTKKNVSTDLMGDKLGRIHLGRQDLGDLQTRKMKGLKRSRDMQDEDTAMAEDDTAKKSKN